MIIVSVGDEWAQEENKFNRKELVAQPYGGSWDSGGGGNDQEYSRSENSWGTLRIVMPSTDTCYLDLNCEPAYVF